MKDVRITVMRKVWHADLSALYELPLDEPCCVDEGEVFVSHAATMPEGMCAEAWKTMREFVEQLANGGGGFYGAWMKNSHSALVSCNDGFRPVSFLLETIE